MTTTNRHPGVLKDRYLTWALMMPTIERASADIATQARDRGWSHEEYLTAVGNASPTNAKPRDADADQDRTLPRDQHPGRVQPGSRHSSFYRSYPNSIFL